MRPHLFIDTGAFYARYVARDEHHETAKALWQKIQKDRVGCVTTNFVVSEMISLMVYRFGNEKALQVARELYGSQALRIVPVVLDLELQALEWIERFQDQSFSMTDAVSFSFMKGNKLETAFTFDHHFEVAGFGRYS